jgi:hypothetical protein
LSVVVGVRTGTALGRVERVGVLRAEVDGVLARDLLVVEKTPAAASPIKRRMSANPPAAMTERVERRRSVPNRGLRVRAVSTLLSQSSAGNRARSTVRDSWSTRAAAPLPTRRGDEGSGSANQSSGSQSLGLSRPATPMNASGLPGEPEGEGRLEAVQSARVFSHYSPPCFLRFGRVEQVEQQAPTGPDVAIPRKRETECYARASRRLGTEGGKTPAWRPRRQAA